MNSAEQKINDAVSAAAQRAKRGETVSISEIAQSVTLSDEEEKEIQKTIITRAISQLVKKGIASDISPEELAEEVSRQIAVNQLLEELDEHLEGDLFVKIR